MPHRISRQPTRPGGSAIDGRTARHAGYWISQQKRKRIEEVFGWLKTVAMLRKTRHRGLPGWVGFYLRRLRLQPRSHAESALPGSSCRITEGEKCVQSSAQALSGRTRCR